MTTGYSANPAKQLRHFPLKYIGHVSIVGDCFCFGLAVEYTLETHGFYPIYLNLAGAATSVEAVWARLAQGKEITVVPLNRDSSAIHLTPPDKGLYVRLQRKIDGLGMDSLILMHRQLAQPSFTETDLAFLIALDDDQACLRLADYVSKTRCSRRGEPTCGNRALGTAWCCCARPTKALTSGQSNSTHPAGQP